MSLSASYLPTLPHIKNQVRRGRCVYDGYQRGWGLHFGEVAAQVRADPIYMRAFERAMPRIIQGEMNRMNIYLILRFFLPRLEFGNIIEFGSYRGGSAIFMASVCQELLPNCIVYALDTFTGMPKADSEIDAHGEGDFADVDYSEMVEYAQRLGLSNLRFIPGLFDATAPAVLAQAGPIALAHIDCDIKTAVRYSYDTVAPFMVSGGYIVLDDATVPSCIGATEAVEEIIQQDRIFSEQIWPHYVFRRGLG